MDSPLLLALPVELVGAIFDTIMDARRTSDALHLGLTCRTMWNMCASFIWQMADSQVVLRGLVFPGIFDSRWLSEYGRKAPVSVVEGVEYRLARYGPLIRALDLGAYWRRFVHMPSLRTAFAILFGRPDVGKSFPSLCSLSLFIPDESDGGADLHNHLLRIPVSALSIEFAATCSISCVKRTLSDIRPDNIYQLSLLCNVDHEFDDMPEKNAALSTFISQFLALNSLSLQFTPGCKPMLRDIAHLAIEQFTLSTKSEYLLGDSYWTLPERAFASLRYLSLLGPPPSNTIGLLRAITSPYVERLELCVYDDRMTPARPILEAVTEKWSHSLHMLVLYRLSNSWSSATLFATLTPLLQCRRMRDCTVLSESEVALDDEHLFPIADAWSDLRVLGFFSFIRADYEPGLINASPLALAHFAEQCPALERLHLTIYFSYQDLNKCPRKFFRPSPLIYLDGTSLHPGAVAPTEITDFVRAVFPHSTNIGCPPGCHWLHCDALGLHCDSAWKDRWRQKFRAVSDGETGFRSNVSWP